MELKAKQGAKSSETCHGVQIGSVTSCASIDCNFKISFVDLQRVTTTKQGVCITGACRAVAGFRRTWPWPNWVIQKSARIFPNGIPALWWPRCGLKTAACRFEADPEKPCNGCLSHCGRQHDPKVGIHRRQHMSDWAVFIGVYITAVVFLSGC